MYSTETFDNLYEMYDSANYQTNNRFWAMIDKLDNKHMVLWAERLSLTKYLSNDSGNDWLKLMDIIKLAKNSNIELTQKQKRFCVLSTVKYWNYLSAYYVI